MKTMRLLVATAALLVGAGSITAQPAPGTGPGPGASAPRGGPGGPGRMGGRWGTDFTGGWSMMTPIERQEHRAKMRSMTTYDDCKTYMDGHHQKMADRAAAKGRTVPAQPRRDACAGLKR